MPEIEEECIFETSRGNVILKTEMNGDQLIIKGLHFTKEQAATLAWLLNNESVPVLKIKIKEKT